MQFQPKIASCILPPTSYTSQASASLSQRQQTWQTDQADQSTYHNNTTWPPAIDSLVTSLPSQPLSSEAEKEAFILSTTSALASLRSTSHQLADSLKSEKYQVAQAKAKVDQARLQLENCRLEEMELEQEIRTESSE